MEQKGKSLNYYMRALHRDIGFLVIGFTIIFSLSGIMLVYRTTDFLKKEKIVEKTVSANLDETALASELHLRSLEVEKEENGIVYFSNGTYEKNTGLVKYSTKELPSFIDKLNGLHRTSSKSLIHVFSTLYAILLFFLAISSFWMFKPSTKMFKRGIVFAVIGIVIAVVALLL